MKNTIKLLLVITLFCGVVLADGNQGGGGRDCPPEGCPPPPCTENCGSMVPADGFDKTVKDSMYVYVIAEVVKLGWFRI